MNKKHYVELEMEITLLEMQDVILASGDSYSTDDSDYFNPSWVLR